MARVLAPGAVTPASVRDAVRAVVAPGAPERAVARGLAVEIAAMPPGTAVVASIEGSGAVASGTLDVRP